MNVVGRACDLMEAVRPEVDSYVLTLLQKRALKKIDFLEKASVG